MRDKRGRISRSGEMEEKKYRGGERERERNQSVMERRGQIKV